MQLSARTLATWGAVALALSNIARAPAALAGRGSALILIDVVTLAVCAFLVLGILTGRIAVKVDRVMAAVGAFLVAAGISTLLALARYSLGITEALGVIAYLVRWVLYFAWYPFIVWAMSPEESARAWGLFERVLIVFTLFGIFQSAFLPGFAQMLETSAQTWDVQGRRLVSTVLDPNFAGILIVVALLARIARLNEGVRENGLALAVLTTGLLLTLSRSALLGFAVGLGVIAVTRGLRLQLVRVLLAGTLLMLPFISLLLSFASGFNKLGVDASAAQRLVPWTRAVLLIRDHPWFGVGFNAYPQAQQARGWRGIGGADYGLDGGLLFAATMTGFVGLFFFVRILWRVVANARSVWRDPAVPAADRAHAGATAACIFAVVVHSLFVNSLFLPFLMQILWVMWGRLAHIAATRRVRLGAVAALPLVFVLTGCEPCAGTAQCAAPRGEVTVTGVVVDYRTGAPVAGARVDGRFIAAGETAGEASAVTGASGVWTMRADVAQTTPLQGVFTVTAPGRNPYTTPAIAIRRPDHAGDAAHVGYWVDVPSTRFIATLGAEGELLTNTRVAFDVTGGVGGAIEEFRGFTDGRGYVEFLASGPTLGPVIGTLRAPDAPDGPWRMSGVPVNLDYRWILDAPVAHLEFRRPRLAFGGATVFRGTRQPVAGVRFEFRQTGGTPIEGGGFTLVSDATGYFHYDYAPPAPGTVIGDVTIRPPEGAPELYPGVTFATHDSLYARDIGVWGYGEGWMWYVDVVRTSDGQPAAGVPVEFHRTSGLMIAPDTLRGATDERGRFGLLAAVYDTGTVTGTITFSPAGGPVTRKELQLGTNPDATFHSAGVIAIDVTGP